MPVDYPDFGVPETSAAYPLIGDLGELAVRLGSIVIFDRRGRVIHFDDFEGPVLRWDGETSPTTYFRLSARSPKSGSQSVQLHVVATAGQKCEIHRGCALLPSEQLGLGIAFAEPDTNSLFHLYFRYWNGTDEYQARIEINFNAKTLRYYDSTGWHEFADTFGFISTQNYHHLAKLVADFETGKYVRFMLNDTEYDLSSYDLYTTPDTATVPHIRIYLALEARVSTASDIYLDDYILTMDEP